MKSHSQSHCSGQSFNAGRIGVKEGMLMLRVVKRNKRSRSMRRPCRRRISRTKKNVYPDQKNGQRVFFAQRIVQAKRQNVRLGHEAGCKLVN